MIPAANSPTWTGQALSRGSEVLVFYMAQRRIGQIAERLIEAGRAAIRTGRADQQRHLP